MTVQADDSIRTMGLFSFTYSPGSEVCNTYAHIIAAYPDTEDFRLTGASKFAQAAGIIGVLMGLTALLLLFLSFFLGCLQTLVTVRIILPILLVVAGIFQVCTFAAADQMCGCPPSFDGENCPVISCNPGDGGNRSIAAFVLYLFNGLLLIFYPRRKTPLFDLAAVEGNTAGGSDAESPTMTRGSTDQGMEVQY
jgi:hypothetical protein